MSGVNAHMLFSQPGTVLSRQAAAMPWRPQRFWPGPMLHRLAHPVSVDSAGGAYVYDTYTVHDTTIALHLPRKPSSRTGGQGVMGASHQGWHYL
jgi:hypothetical protein